MLLKPVMLFCDVTLILNTLTGEKSLCLILLFNAKRLSGQDIKDYVISFLMKHSSDNSGISKAKVNNQNFMVVEKHEWK